MIGNETQSVQAGPDPGFPVELCVPFSRYRFLFVKDPAARLPEWTGSMWRGALGHALRRTACVTGMKECTGCLLHDSCAYSYLFESSPPRSSRKMRCYNQVPHPYLIDSYQKPTGDGLALTVVLIGRANRYLPYLVHAMIGAASDGVSRQRIPLRFTGLQQETTPASGEWVAIYLPGGSLQARDAGVPLFPALTSDQSISLQTPLRVNRDGRLVGAGSFQFSDLFNNLLRRVSMLSHFYTDKPFETDFACLTREARKVDVYDAQLHWQEQTRYSNRQRSRMQMGGIVGNFSVHASDLEPFWPVLWLGQWLHAGKATSMGLGRYRLTAAASLQAVTTDKE